MFRSKIKIYTSYVTENNFNRCRDLGLIPIIIMRKIYNSPVVGHLSDTVFHVKDLAPSDELLWKFKNKEIDVAEYQKRLALDFVNVDFDRLIHRWEDLLNVFDGTTGIVLMSYDLNYNISHRKVVSSLLNASGLLENEVYEIG